MRPNVHGVPKREGEREPFILYTYRCEALRFYLLNFFCYDIFLFTFVSILFVYVYIEKRRWAQNTTNNLIKYVMHKNVLKMHLYLVDFSPFLLHFFRWMNEEKKNE